MNEHPAKLKEGGGRRGGFLFFLFHSLSFLYIMIDWSRERKKKKRGLLLLSNWTRWRQVGWEGCPQLPTQARCGCPHARSVYCLDEGEIKSIFRSDSSDWPGRGSGDGRSIDYCPHQFFFFFSFFFNWLLLLYGVHVAHGGVKVGGREGFLFPTSWNISLSYIQPTSLWKKKKHYPYQCCRGGQPMHRIGK